MRSADQARTTWVRALQVILVACPLSLGFSERATAKDAPDCARTIARHDMSTKDSRDAYVLCVDRLLERLRQPNPSSESLSLSASNASDVQLLRVLDVELLAQTQALEKSIGQTLALVSQQSKELAQQNTSSQAQLTAQVSAAQAQIAAEQSVAAGCRYKSNVLTALAGLVSFARAVKIRDDLTVASLLAPVAFSACDKSGAQTSVLFTVSPLALKGKVGGATQQFTIASGSPVPYAVSSADATICKVEQPDTSALSYVVTFVAAGDTQILVKNGTNATVQSVSCHADPANP
jgi:hypothetical protein